MCALVSQEDSAGDTLEASGHRLDAPSPLGGSGFALHGATRLTPEPRDQRRGSAPLPRRAPFPVGAESGSVGGSAGRAQGGPPGGWSSERVWAAAGSAMETVQLRNPPRR